MIFGKLSSLVGNSRTKGWVVHLHLCALIHNLASRVAVTRSGQALLVVVDVMLSVSDDALALNALDDRLDQDETEVRILARAAEGGRENITVRKENTVQLSSDITARG